MILESIAQNTHAAAKRTEELKESRGRDNYWLHAPCRDGGRNSSAFHIITGGLEFCQTIVQFGRVTPRETGSTLLRKGMGEGNDWKSHLSCWPEDLKTAELIISKYVCEVGGGGV